MKLDNEPPLQSKEFAEMQESVGSNMVNKTTGGLKQRGWSRPIRTNLPQTSNRRVTVVERYVKDNDVKKKYKVCLSPWGGH